MQGSEANSHAPSSDPQKYVCQAAMAVKLAEKLQRGSGFGSADSERKTLNLSGFSTDVRGKQRH